MDVSTFLKPEGGDHSLNLILTIVDFPLLDYTT